ncbi:MAG TPA: S9 family peptidase [Steroidobacteraceae bacterium]|nr:S9 family peptidase [Steroidobacteraceae bacterium]
MRYAHFPPYALALLVCLAPAAWAGRALTPEDWYRFKDVSDLTMAPDGKAVAYLVTTYDQASDQSRSALWLADWAGNGSVELTRGESVSEPRFSPDGRYISFLAARPADAATQLYLLDRRGGEPQQLTHVNGVITSYQWAPDGRRLVLVMHGSDADAPEARSGAEARGGGDAPRPLVIDAFHFKQDKDGYLTAESRTHLCLLEVAGGPCRALAADALRADSAPAFSPDGKQIAFVGNRDDSARQLGRDEILLVAAEPGAQPRRLLTTWSPNHQHLEWSPDGTLVAFLEGDEPRYNAYMMDRLALIEVSSGGVRQLTGSLDRAVLSPVFSADGQAIEFAVEDDGYQYPAQIALAGGALKRLAGPIVVEELAAAAGHTAVLSSSDRAPVEVYALEEGRLRPLSAHNQALFAELALGTVEDITFKTRDGTPIHGQQIVPPDFVRGRRYPTIVWIHGGPNGQDDHSLELAGYGPPLERQLFATHGYVVLAINYRGGTGRGAQFARSIAGDWGHKEVEDLLAGVDYAIAAGIADPARLGVGGWSYGGLLTDYTIASDRRFKAAIAGAGSGNQLSTYGSDEYLLQYNAELGPPWRTTALWLKVSYPFIHADRIRTPTLFLGGDRDFNVPIGGGEQMYQALRTLGVPAQLIVYPGEYHVLTRPSFLVDRSRRYLEWMDKYLRSEAAAAPASTPER